MAQVGLRSENDAELKRLKSLRSDSTMANLYFDEHTHTDTPNTEIWAKQTFALELKLN